MNSAPFLSLVSSEVIVMRMSSHTSGLRWQKLLTSLTVRSAEDRRRRLSSRDPGSSKQMTKIQKASRSKNIILVHSRTIAHAAHSNTANKSNIEIENSFFKKESLNFYWYSSHQNKTQLPIAVKGQEVMFLCCYNGLTIFI
jgi:hypothetical protein